MAKKPVPEFTNIDEMARFFDETDTTELDPGPMEREEYEPKRVVLSIRLDASDDAELSQSVAPNARSPAECAETGDARLRIAPVVR